MTKDEARGIENALIRAGKPLTATVDTLEYRTKTGGRGFMFFPTHDDLCFFLQGVKAVREGEEFVRAWVKDKEVDQIGVLWSKP